MPKYYVACRLSISILELILTYSKGRLGRSSERRLAKYCWPSRLLPLARASERVVLVWRARLDQPKVFEL